MSLPTILSIVFGGILAGYAFVMCTVRLAAILQQEGYAGGAFLRWYYRGRNIERKKASLHAVAIALLTALFSVCFSFLGYKLANLISILPFVGICVLYCYAEGRHALKVPAKPTARAVRLAQETGARLHVAHVSTARELKLFRPNSRRITAEVCVPHLLFSDRDYARLGSRIKCNPAVKTEADRDALRRAIASGVVSTVATDHAPHQLCEKQGGCVRAASGMPMVQFSLPAMLDLVDEGVLPVERLVELMCHNPATLFDIENRGFLREGYKADLVLVRPRSLWTLPPCRIESKCGWSPLEGHTFRWRVEKTYCNGFLIYNDGRITDTDFHGQAVTYNR